MESMKPIIVDWQIISACTRQCGFCYGPQSHIDVDLDKIYKMIDNFKMLGVKVVGITGGEPLLVPKIDEIFKYIKENGMAICLSSNFDLYDKYRDAILKYVDTLGIPVEGASEEIHNSLRGKGSYKNISHALEDVTSNSDIKFRIGTVITELNYRDLVNIEKFLSNYKKHIVYWKMYEYIIYFPDKQSLKLQIKNRDEMLSIIDKLGQHLDKDAVIFDTQKKRSNSYFLIKPNGDVFVPILNQDTKEMDENVIGNVLENPKGVLKTWQDVIDPEGYNHIHRCIYRKDCSLRCKYLY